MISGAVRKTGCSRLPKWFELQPGETYKKSILSRQVSFVVLMSIVVVIAVVFLIAMAVTDGDKSVAAMGGILGSISGLGTLLGTSKLYITDRRLVLELKRKFAGEIPLDGIRELQVSRGMMGGKLLVVPVKPGAGAIQVSVLRPQELAEQISQLAAEAGSESNSSQSQFSAGGGK